MLDMMRISTNQRVNLDYIGRIPGMKQTPIKNYGYQYAVSYAFSEKIKFSIRCEPLLAYLKKYTVIDFNPSQFQNFKKYKSFLEYVFPKFDFDEPSISRIDLAVDVQIPVSFFWNHLYIRRKRTYETISSTGDSIVIGRSPLRTSIYDKARQLKLPKNKCLTRVEIQFRYQSCPVKKFNEIKKLLTFNPFRNFIFYALNKDRRNFISRGIKSSIEDFGMFVAIRKEIGTEQLKTLLNKKYIYQLEGPKLWEQLSKEMQDFLQDGEATNL